MKEIIIRLSEADYRAAQARAGGQDLEAYVLEVLQADLELESFDHIFTPEYLEKLHAASADAKSGNSFTWDEVEQRLNETKQAWRQKRSSA